jgi:CRISPR system Cascade subunit CasE
VTVYLSRLLLDLRSSAVRRDLRDVQQLHRTIMAQFDPAAGNRAAQKVLFRLELGPTAAPALLIQSAAPPRWALDEQYSARPPETKDIGAALASITAGQRLRFRLRANPARRPAAKERPNAPRMPITSWEGRLAWLQRKLNEAGASPLEASVDVVSQPRDTGRNNGHHVTIWPVLFEGVLTVHDPDLLRGAIAAGIGPARAYGNGLLSVAATYW